MNKKNRYENIAFALEQGIVEGKYKVGELLPTEAKLCQQFQVSRFTTRAALKQLEEKGLIKKQQGKGSVVINTNPSVMRITWSTVDELLEHAEEAQVSIESVDEIKMAKTESRKIGFQVNQAVLQIKGMRYFTFDKKSKTPICTLHVWLNSEFGLNKEELISIKGSIIKMAEEKHNVLASEVQQSISAIILSEDIANRLDTKAGQAALRLMRKYYTVEGTLIEVSETIFPSNLFEYQMHLQRS